MAEFVGRAAELDRLKGFLKKTSASFVVVRGRRRIGKSRLVEEFSKPYGFFSFSGVAPTPQTTAQDQRDEFAMQLVRQGFPKIKMEDWNELFWLLADKTQKGRVIILLDEISWMGSEDPLFLGKLKNAWDLHFKKNPQSMLILCGSASSWIEKNILSNTGFLGRISFTLTLDELPLNDCQRFWGKQSRQISALEKLKMLSVTGGIPRYLEEIDPRLDAESNIKNLCFTKGAFLVEEFERIFSTLFLRESESYQKIVRILADGSKEFTEISKELGVEHSGRIFQYIEELQLAGFVQRQWSWHLNTGLDSRLSRYRLSDNYLRFYLKYIEKYKTKIDRRSFDFKSLSALPVWESMMALQFENLVLNNRGFIWKTLGIKPEEILSENPFFQHQTKAQKGCQIDYLIQTRFGSLYICEIKFSKNPVSPSIIEEVQQKIDRIKKPKGLSCRPVLIHVGGVHSDVEDSGFFSEIIDFGEIFN